MINNIIRAVINNDDNYKPELGEVVQVFDSENIKLKIGDGVSLIKELPDILIDSKKFGTGCMMSPYDIRDYQFSDIVVGLSRERFPKEYIPNYGIKPFDQGTTSMCCACAVAMSRYIFEIEDSGNTKLFSPGYIYANRTNSVVCEGIYEGEGMYLKDALKQLCHSGDCFYDYFDEFGLYDDLKKSYISKSATLDQNAYPFRTSSYYAVKTEKEIMKAILSTGSVITSFLVTSGWYYVEKDGIIPTFGSIEGAHAVLIIGWKIIDNKKYWIILNSWGDQWGDNGLGYIETTSLILESYCIIDDVKEIQLKNK